MDVAMVRGRIQATLEGNAAIRQQAELDLRYVRPRDRSRLSGDRGTDISSRAKINPAF